MTILNLGVGCTATLPKKVGIKELKSENPAVQILAVKWAGDNKVEKAVPLLVDLLDNQDAAVRFYAIIALKKITGRDFGYHYKDDATSRYKALEKWRKFLKAKKYRS